MSEKSPSIPSAPAAAHAADTTHSAIRPFLLLSTRPEDPTAEGEYESFRTVMGLEPHELIQRRVEQQPLGDIVLDDYSGIIIGGGPYNNTDATKDATQQRVEKELGELTTRILDRDYPLFAACYGIGIVGTAIGATLSRNYPEPASAITVHVTDAGAEEPLLQGTPRHFDTLVGHKENIETLPEVYTRADGSHLPVRLLVTGDACPVHMFTVGRNIFVTQFHPELDHDSFAVRVHVYQHKGYFPPEDAEKVIAQATAHNIADSQDMLRRFSQRYRVPAAKPSECPPVSA